MSDELLSYFFHLHGLRNIRYAAPEYLNHIYNKYKNLTPQQKSQLSNDYQKNKSKVFKLLEI